jgi:predicted  nucleic acid-binding Zn-ribbon protein
MTDPSPRQGASAKPVGQDQTPPKGAATPSSDDVLSVLEEFEAGLDSLKQLYVQRQQLADDLKRRSDNMTAAENELKERKEEFQLRQRELAHASSSLGEKWKQLEAREAQLESDQASHEARAAELKALDETLAAKSREADAATRRVEQLAAEIEARDADLRARDKTQTAALAQRQQDLADQGVKLQEETAKIAAATGAIATERDRLNAARTELEATGRKLADDRTAFESQEKQLETLRAELEAERTALNSLQAELEQRANAQQQSSIDTETLRAESQALTARLAEADKKLHEQTIALDSAHKEHEAAVKQLRERTDELEKRLETERTGRGVDSQRSGKTEQELAAALAGAETARKELAEARVAAQKSQDELTAAIACCRDVFEEYESLWKHEVIEHLRTRVALGAVEQSLAQREATIAEYEAQQASQPEPSPVLAPANTEQTDALTERLRKACEALVQLRDERQELTERISTLESELDRTRKLLTQAKSSPAPAASQGAFPAQVKRRRDRLGFVRKLALERSKKIKKAEDALATRFEACERILSMRQELAEARELITAAQRKTERHRAGGKTAALAFYGTAAAALLGVISWFGTQAMIPGQYAAHALIAADSKGRSLGPGEYAEWQTFHENMVTDPAFMEVAAERMTRRGITELGKAADLAQEAKKSLSAIGGNDGELKLEWRGQGAERTQRILDTLVTALASQANAARERRVDGSVTAIKLASTAGTERLDTDYRMIAAGVWGGSMILIFGFGTLIWRRLANAKATFEGSVTVDAALDVRRWNLPTRKDGV